ncbi:MAG: PD40 domain-containing protein [Solirubrobacterales bacterium]|nr:PD40 domain-containing protein [Solirubrobacterales bacterium]MCB0860453.1 PD40 domain-containing protein [Solirubrobacterales bacterium]
MKTLFATFIAVTAFAVPGAAAAGTPEEDPAEIVFENGGRIVSIKADGSGRTVLTRKNAWVGQPWGINDIGPLVSPDGNSILFNRYNDGFNEGIPTGLMLMNRDGSGIHPAYEPPDGAELFSGNWSSDGERIYLIEYSEESTPTGGIGTTTLFSVKTDGTDRKVITKAVFEYDEEDDKVTGQKWIPVDVASTQDGSRLLITTYNFFTDKPTRLEWVNPDTGTRSIFEDSAASPSFSPDGTEVAFSSDRDGINVTCYEGNCSGDAQIFIKEVSSGVVRRLLPGSPVGASGEPDWSSDGNRIAFTSTRSPGISDVGAEIWTVAPDGSCLTRLTNGAPDSDSPQWVPGGSAAACFDLAPAPLGEVTVSRHVSELKLPPLWAGRSLGGQLMNDSFQYGASLGTYYSDCGRTDGDCMPPVAIDSEPVCGRSLNGDLMTGRYLGMERRRGGLLIRNTSRRGLTSSSFYSGGLETEFWILARQKGMTVGFGYHRRMVDRLRPAGQVEPVAGNLGGIVLPWTAVRKSRIMLRVYRKTHSLKQAAERSRVFNERGFIGIGYNARGARAWLKFGRDLRRLGKVKSVKCKRWKNLPATISVHSRAETDSILPFGGEDPLKSGKILSFKGDA